MHPMPRRFISINTGSNALSCGLLAAIAAVSIVIGLARYDLTRPVDHSTFPKFHGEADRLS